MTFLQPLLWLGAFLVGVPLWLHLRRRRPEGMLAFSALRFLDDQPRPRQGSLRLRDVLLFILRALALLLVVAAFSRPAWRSGATTVGESRVHVLDNTLSRQADGGFERDRQTLIDRLASAPEGQQDAVVLLEARPRLLAGFGDDREQTLTTLRQLEPSHQRGAYLDAFRLAHGLFDQALGERHRLFYLGDHQANQWSEDAASPPFLRRVEIDPGPAPAPDWIEGRPNLGLGAPRARLYFVGDETWVDLAVDVMHHGLEEAELVLEVVGEGAPGATPRRLLDRRLALEGQPPVITLRAQWAIDPNRWVEGVLEARSDGDVLAADDRAFFALPPVREGRLAVLARSPYLRLALSPEVMRGRWSSTLLDPGQLESSPLETGDSAGSGAGDATGGDATGGDPKELADVLVVEAGMAQGQAARELLMRHLRGGRGVILVLDRLTPLVRSLLEELDLFVAPGAAGEADADEGPQPSQGFRYFAVHHPIFRPFVEGELGDLLAVRVHRATTLLSRSARPLIYGDAGGALLVESVKAKGRLLVFPFAFDPGASSWPLEPSFIPFLDLSLQYARAAGELVTDWRPGELYVQRLAAGRRVDSARLLGPFDPRQRAAALACEPGVVPPPPEAGTVSVDDGMVRFTIPDQPGLYTLQFDDVGDGAGTPETLLAVNPSPFEGELVADPEPAALDSWRLRTLADESVSEDPAEGAAQPREVERPREGRAWWWLLVLAVLLLGAETVGLARPGRFARPIPEAHR